MNVKNEFSMCTANVNGLRDRGKRQKIFEYFKTSKYDIIFMQEVHITNISEAKIWGREWEGKCFWSFGTANSCGVGIIFRKNLDVQIQKFHLDTSGRYIVVDCSINSCQIKLLNVYAPNNPAARKDFFNQIQYQLYGNQNIILGGDFNCIEFDKDKIGNLNFGKEGKDEIQEIKETFQLKDAYRKKYPNNLVYSWQNETKQIKSRIDRIYLSKQLNQDITSIQYIPWHLSDHSILSIKLNFQNNIIRGAGYWKCNIKVLSKPEIKMEIIKLLEETDKTLSLSLQQWWEHIKTKIKDIIIKYSKLNNKTQYRMFKELQEKLSMYKDFETLEPGKFKEKIKNINQEIDNLLLNRIEGSKIRSKVKYIEENEKPNKFFLQTEKKRNNKKDMNKIKNDKGEDITSNIEITNYCKEYYKNLYAEEEIDDTLLDYFLKDTNKLNEIDKNICEGPITYDECVKALNEMKNGKSPGIDGLPAEFYKEFFPYFGEKFVEMINHSFEKGTLCQSQRLGIITLICKNVEQSEFLTHWRPISLLNVDYKIVSKVLSKRLKLVLENIISIDQTCSVPGRSILDNVHLLRNIIDYVKQKNIGCAILSLDQSKAFDRVSHKYLNEVLKAFGFGDSFIRWIQLLYTDISSSILVNGHISDSFNVERSVRQGCSLSPLLYILCMEPFANKIRKDKMIEGLKLPGSNNECKISQYADDTNIIITSKDSVRKVLIICELYGLVSGAKLNKDKSKGIWLGAWKNNSDIKNTISWVKENKINGVIVGGDCSLFKNFDKLVQKVKNCLDINKQRNLSIFGKACIINTLACGKLWYHLNTQVMHDVYLTRFTKLLFSYIWNDKTELVKRETLYLSKEQGGIGLIHIKSKMQAFQVKHIKQLIYGQYAKWHDFAIYWIGLKLRKYKDKFANNNIPHSYYIPYFYESCIKSLDATQILHNFDLETSTTNSIYNKFCKQIGKTPRIETIFPNINFGWVDIDNKVYSSELKNLNWRVLHHIIPCKAELYKRRISQNSDCPRCKAVETVIHVFYSCNFVKQFWTQITPVINNLSKQNFSSININEIVFHSFGNRNIVYKLLVSEAKYVIWHCRNILYKENVNVDTKFLCDMFKDRLKIRIRADSVRLIKRQFQKLWLNNDLISLEDDVLNIRL